MARKTTRNAQGAGSLRQRADGTWEARYTVGRDPGTGKQIRKSVYGKTQKEARQKLAQAVAALDTGTYFEPSKMTMEQWLDIWTKEYMGDKKYLTVKHYKAQVEAHIKPALGAVKLSQLAPHTIQKFYNDLLKTGRSIPKRDKDGKVLKKDGKTVCESAPMSAKSVRNVHGILTKALSVAVSAGYLRDNPADRVTLPRVEKKEIHPLTDEQVKNFLQTAAGDEYEIILKLILFTGLREAEATGLTWDCVDFNDGTVKVCKQLQKRPLKDGGFTFAPLKNDKVRVLKPAPFVMDLLKRRQKEQGAQRLKAGQLWQGWSTAEERKTALVFTTATGGNLSPQTVYNHYKKLAVQIGAPDSRVHDLRHTFAVLSLQNGDDVKTVQGNLGHATAAFTLDVYGHVSERMKEDSAARMEEYIKELVNR
ncbi:site-specific integrase [Intestinimonas butyriciproducens]|uniref:Site-specific recombinase XerD n=1 Tax=Intestinimonas butyriciproducens TaxID=1297617 RepID=A0A2U1CCC6_9FIRM|nr:site-specific integrase [Intestinimonas butyriciproducens]MCR1906107.1 site-specific integrase [Intestinimonas butyriciproducens]PVY58584.1 site-specific recombinase XerD [Intestinimonas butyriciproducens]QBB65607.1 Phage integrase [Intestinimonas butyriciproducens]